MFSAFPEFVNEKGLASQPTTDKFYGIWGTILYIIGFARVFSGTLTRGQKVYVIGPKAKSISRLNKFSVNLFNSYLGDDNQDDNSDIWEVTIERIYLIMA